MPLSLRSSVARFRYLVALAAGITLLATAPAWARAVAHAQQGCMTDDPPCPQPPPLAVGVQAPSDTVRANPVTVSFNVTGLGGGTLSSSATMDGVAVGAPTWQYESNGASVSGYVQVSPQLDGQHTVVVTFCEVGRSPPCASDAATVIYKSPPSAPTQGAPIVTQEPGSRNRRSLGGCAGCAYATLSYSTPGYRSLDQGRGLTLLYSSATSAPRGTVVLDVNANSATAPDRMSVQLLKPDGSLVTLTNGQTELFYAGGPDSSRLTAQFDAMAYGTNLYAMTAVVRNWWNTGVAMAETTTVVNAIVVNERSSGFGSGWTVAGVQQMRVADYPTREAIFFENGTVTIFLSCGVDCWARPPGEGSTFGWSADGQRLERRYRDGTVVEFDPNTWRHTRTRDRLGLTTLYEYDAYSRLYRVTDPVGIVTSIAWSGAPGVARTASITAPSPGGGTTRVNISAAGELISIVDPDNVTALSVSYTNNRIASATNRIGGTTDFAYDSFGGLSSVTGPLVDTEDFGRMRPATTYRSREAALLPALGTGTATSPAPRVLPTAVWLAIRSQRGDSTRIASNGAGDLTAVIKRDAQGKQDSTIVGYDANHQPASVWSSSGTRMEYRWNGPLLVKTVDNVASVTTDLYYNALGQDTATRVNQVLQQRKVYSVDSMSVLKRVEVGSSVSLFTYDALGRVLTATDAGQHQTSFTYHPGQFQNVASVTKNGQTTSFGYDALGRPQTVTDPLGHIRTTNYDLLNRVTSVSAPSQGVSSWGYDDATRQYTFTNANNQVYRSVLDGLGQPVLNYEPSSGTPAVNWYDSDGNLVIGRSKGGRTVSLVRDVLGRVTQITAGSLVTTIAYDTARKWTAYSTAESSDTVYVDGDGRVTRQSSLRGSQRYAIVTTYGERGQKRSLTLSSPAWSSASRSEVDVDSLLRPDYVGSVEGSWTSITYNQDQQPERISFPQSGATRRRQTLGYTTGDQLASSTSNVAPDVLSWSYNYDALGRLSLLSQGAGTSAAVRTADYDAAGRLAHWVDYRTVEGQGQWICPDPFDESSCYWYQPTQSQAVRDSTYTYDAVGNRTDLPATVQAGDRLTSFNGFTMGYDDDGNLVSKTGNGVTQSFSWNALGQLASATSNGVTTSYGYDALGRRIRKTVNGVPTQFLYDGDNLVAQLTAAGVRQLEFTYYPGVDHPHSVRESATGNLYYYATSQPGHVIALVDRYDQVVNRYEYTPFGESVSATGPVVQPFRFAGRELDAETGLYYNRARYYDPTVGRFISEDPIGLAGGVNQYTYAANDPVNGADPFGLEPCTEEQLARGAIQADFSDGNSVCKESTGLPTIVTTAPRTPPPMRRHRSSPQEKGESRA